MLSMTPDPAPLAVPRVLLAEESLPFRRVIREALTAHPGETPVLLHFQNSAGKRVTVETGETFRVARGAALDAALDRWTGD